jgi:hypothetical protein
MMVAYAGRAFSKPVMTRNRDATAKTPRSARRGRSVINAFAGISPRTAQLMPNSSPPPGLGPIMVSNLGRRETSGEDVQVRRP